MDVVAVEAAARHAASETRRTRSPFFLEALTYRFRAHSMYDAELYRARSEVLEWSEKHDPITNFRSWLRERAWLDDAQDAELERSVNGEVAGAVAEAERGPLEPVASLLDDVYAEPSS
jgi:TPP-dependent pyruvate/acetoin dehydrogenase alpha subunit